MTADHPTPAEGIGEHREKLLAALLSVGVNLSLIAVEAVVAWFTGSLAVLADAGHSTFDLFASVAAVWGVRMAAAPPDRDHLYGHEKYENISSLVQVVLLGLISLFIVVEIGIRLATGFTLAVSGAALIIILVTLVVDWLVARYLSSVARRHHSFALEADAYHFTTDFWGKIAVIVGLTAALAGQKWIDPAAALVVAGLMLYTGWRLGRRSTQVLLDAAPRDSLQSKVREILAAEAGDAGFHSLRMRQAGKWVVLDVALHLPAQMSIAEGHEKAHHLCRRLRAEIPQVREAVVHIEPEDTHHE